MDAKTIFSDTAKRAELFSRFMSRATVANVMRDTRAFLAYLAAERGVRTEKSRDDRLLHGGPVLPFRRGTLP